MTKDTTWEDSVAIGEELARNAPVITVDDTAKAREERQAWDKYAAAALKNSRWENAACEADSLLEQRRKRFK